MLQGSGRPGEAGAWPRGPGLTVLPPPSPLRIPRRPVLAVVEVEVQEVDVGARERVLQEVSSFQGPLDATVIVNLQSPTLEEEKEFPEELRAELMQIMGNYGTIVLVRYAEAAGGQVGRWAELLRVLSPHSASPALQDQPGPDAGDFRRQSLGTQRTGHGWQEGEWPLVTPRVFPTLAWPVCACGDAQEGNGLAVLSFESELTGAGPGAHRLWGKRQFLVSVPCMFMDLAPTYVGQPSL